eukprot:g667.t1
MIFSFSQLGPRFSTITVVVGQVVIPLTIFLSWLIVPKREITTWIQLLGAVIVIVGVCVSIAPQLFSIFGLDGTGAKWSVKDLTWLTVYSLATVPQALNFVLLECVFRKEKEIEAINDSAALKACLTNNNNNESNFSEATSVSDLAESNSALNRALARSNRLKSRAAAVVRESLPGMLLRTCILTACMNIVSLPVNLLTEVTIASIAFGPKKMTQMMMDEYRVGWDCFYHGLKHSMGMHDALLEQQHCTKSFELAVTFAPLGSAFIIGAVLVTFYASSAVATKGSGAAFSFLVAAFCLPIENLLMSMPLIMGGNKKIGSTGISLYVGIFVIMLGIVMFVRGRGKKDDDDGDEDDDRRSRPLLENV